MQDWYNFKGETKEFYGIDMSVLEVSMIQQWAAAARWLQGSRQLSPFFAALLCCRTPWPPEVAL